MWRRPTWLLIVLCAAVLMAIAISSGFGHAQQQSPLPRSPEEVGAAADGRSGRASPRNSRQDEGDAAAAADSAGRFSLTSTTVGSDRAIVVMDSATQRLLVYTIDNASRPPLLKLVAVRNISHDIKLEHWNNAHPYPDEIRRSAGEGPAD